MSITQNIARHVLSDRLYESLRGESQTWTMRCPCGAETSVWEMGGIRWKATGEPRRMGRCGTCCRSFWGQLYRRAQTGSQLRLDAGSHPQHRVLHQTLISAGHPLAAVNGNGFNRNTMSASAIDLKDTNAVQLWIDGVGSWVVFLSDVVSVGGPVEPGSSQQAADLCVLANLRRLHTTIERTGESYRVQSVDDDEAKYLRDGDEIAPGGRLSMQFRTPSVLSPTAVLLPAGEPWPRMFTEGRTPASVDGVVLMDQVCLLGSGSDAHILCRDWEEPVILFRRNNQLCVRSQTEIELDGQLVDGTAALVDGSVVSSEQWRFRVESV